MKCAETRENLAAYLDGEIDGAPRRAMDAHFAACADCEAERAAQAAAWRLLDLAAPPAVPAGLRDRILARARTAPPAGRILRLPWPVAAAAAAVLLAVGGGFLYLHGRSATPEAARAGGPPEQLLDDLTVIESMDLLRDGDVDLAGQLSDYPVEDLEILGG